MITEALIVSALLFVIGVVGVLTRRNAIILFMCAELMLNAVNLSFVAFAKLHNVTGHVFVIMVMTIAAAEAVVGLSLILRVSNTSADVQLRVRERKGKGGCLTAQQGQVLSGYIGTAPATITQRHEKCIETS